WSVVRCSWSVVPSVPDSVHAGCRGVYTVPQTRWTTDHGRRTMRKSVVLITGGSGEIGHRLITRLADDNRRAIVTVDLNPLATELANLVRQQILGSILDTQLLERILAEYEVDLVFHLAALLSTRCEFTPTSAHRVNVEGTMNLLEFAQKQGE